MADHYKPPDPFTRHLFNPLVTALTKLGVSIYGSRVLEVRGRTSGQWRSTPVNILTLDGSQYLLAPRGHTQWVRNIRAAGGGRLRLGRRIQQIRVSEVPDADKPSILRAYLKRWGWETGMFFEGVNAQSGDSELLRIAPDHPVFRLEPS